MVYYKKYPTVNEGIRVLFDTSEPIKKILANMLGQVDLDDKYLFISEMEAGQFREYYQSVVQKCYELNELFVQEGSVNTTVVTSKLMYVCHNLESCYFLKDYLQSISDPEELVRGELTYTSTYHIVSILDISEPFL